MRKPQKQNLYKFNSIHCIEKTNEFLVNLILETFRLFFLWCGTELYDITPLGHYHKWYIVRTIN